jgi:hypothetical protein
MSKRTRKKVGIRPKLILYLVLSLSIILYLVYALFLFLGIHTKNPLIENVSSHKILSVSTSDLEKTAYIFEKGDGEERRISEIFVFLSNRRKDLSLLIHISGNLYFSGLEENFGSPISISSLRYAGDFLQENRGVEYTLWQLNEILGFKVDNYIWFTPESYAVLEDVYGELNEVKAKYREGYIIEGESSVSDSFFKLHTLSTKYTALKTLLGIRQVATLDGKIYSNFSFVNVLRKVNSFKNTVKNTRTEIIDLGSFKYSSEDMFELGGRIRSINITEYDKALRGYIAGMMDRNLEKERIRVEVYNASSLPGRAGVYARKILNNGCDVVRFGNAPENIERTQIYISNSDDFAKSLDIVSEVLLGKFEELSERPSFMTTGDIVILLGEDITQVEIF